MRVLLLEDDDIVADAIVRGLTMSNFAVDRAAKVATAEALFEVENFDLAVVDIALPDGDGMALVRRLRKRGKTFPVLILTAHGTLDAKVSAFDLGADDFLGKPFEIAELLARCRALIRRAHAAAAGTVTFGRLLVDVVGKQLCVDGRDVALTLREWQLLECLVLHSGQIVTKERLLQSIASLEHNITPNAIEVHISRLRAKLGDAAIIRALRGLGYRLEEA